MIKFILLSILCFIPTRDPRELNKTRIVKQQVDIIELNHVLNENGAPVLDQLIFWKDIGPQRIVSRRERIQLLRTDPIYFHFRNYSHEYEVIDFRLIEDKKAHRCNYSEVEIEELKKAGYESSDIQLFKTNGYWMGGPMSPKYDAKTKYYYVKFYDKKDKINRYIYATHYRETSTRYDPEMLHRNILPKPDRDELEK